MQFGNIAKKALIRADLPLDIEHIELAKDFLEDNIESVWGCSDTALWRQSSSTITTVVGSDTYVLNRYVDKILKNSLRGPSTNTRSLDYYDPITFFRRYRDTEGTIGNPFCYTFGEMVGYDNALEVTSPIECYSQFANKTTGTVQVFAGSKKILGTGTQFSSNDVGKRFKKSGDNETYLIGKFINSQWIELDENYRGYSSTGSDYIVGDVGIKVGVSGFVGGVLDSEEIELNGSTAVSGIKNFTTLVSLTKSDVTGGGVICRAKNKTTNIVGIFTPGDQDIERQTIKLWYIPDSVETLSYRFVMKHPKLSCDSDRVLIPEKYHDGLVKMTTADLLEWSGKAIGAKLAGDIEEYKNDVKNDAEDMSNQDAVSQDEMLDFNPGNYYKIDTTI